MTPPAPSPHSVLAAMKEPMLGAMAHQNKEKVKMMLAAFQTVQRPMMSEIGAKSGIIAVEVMRKVVESQGAALDALKKDVTTGWIEAMTVESKEATYKVIVSVRVSGCCS